MNCEACGEVFKGIVSLRKHEATEIHQDNIKRHQNMLLGHSEVVTDVESNTVAAKASDAVEDLVPVSVNAVSVVANSLLPVPRSKNKNAAVFLCMSCSMSFISINDIVQHAESGLHTNMALATGIEEQADDNEQYIKPIPALFYCITCNFQCFNSSLYAMHLKTKIHKRMVQFVKNLSNRTEENGLEQLVTKNSPMLPAMPDCKLCNIRFKTTKFYEQHLNGKRHEKVLRFMRTILKSKKENGVCSTMRDTEDMNTSLIYCELCNISLKSSLYEGHLKGKIHTRVEQFMKLFDGKPMNILNILDGFDEFKKTSCSLSSWHYCELCLVWCTGFKCYEIHLKGKKHARKANPKLIDTQETENASDSSPKSYVCELCCSRFTNSKRHKGHMKSKVHKRIEQLMIKLPNEEEEKIGACIDAQEDRENIPYYCELCETRCSDSDSYNKHLQSKNHKKIKRIISGASKKTI